MARIRTIKPELWADEKFGQLDGDSQLLFIGLISQADDAGRLLDSVRLIDGLLYPYDDSRTSRESLANLSRLGLIRRGQTASGQRVIQIVGWAKHQRVDKPNLQSALPEIVPETAQPRDSGIAPECVANDSGMIPEKFPTHIYDLRSTTNDQRASCAREADASGGPGPERESDEVSEPDQPLDDPPPPTDRQLLEHFNELARRFGGGSLTDAEQAYLEHVPERISPEDMLVARKRYCESLSDQKLRKALGRWIRGREYDDDRYRPESDDEFLKRVGAG